jgi:hypothetical protein
MPAWPGFTGPSYRSRSLDVSPERTINMYGEVADAGGTPPQLVLYGMPGLRRRRTFVQGPVRGLYTASNGRVFAVSGSRLSEVFSAGPPVERGTLVSTTGLVSMTDNGLLLALVDGAHGYGLDFTTQAFSATTDTDFHGGATIAFLDGRFVWNVPGTGQYQWSELYSPSIDSLAFATAEARPDPLVGLLVSQRELWLFGTQTTEVLYSTGDPFTPFQRLPGAFQEVGSVGPWVAQALGNTVIWVTQNTQGQGVVVAAQQYQPRRISTPPIEWALSQSRRLAEAVGMAYSQAGHSWYGLYVPDLETSYWYDVSTQQWSERGTLWANSLRVVSGDDPVWYPWRPYVHTFGHGQHLVGSWEAGTLWTLDPTCYTDDDRPLVRQRITPTLRQDQDWVQLTRLRVHLETGVGLDGGVVPGSDPQVMLRLSRDGGRIWDNARWASAHRLGQSGRTVEWRRLGRARQFTAEVSVSDPVPVTILGASLA